MKFREKVKILINRKEEKERERRKTRRIDVKEIQKGIGVSYNTPYKHS